MTQTQRRPFIFLVLGIAAFLLPALIALPLIWTPLWFDQGAFGACADVLRRGGLFFRDCWDVRGPLTPILYAIPTLVS